MRMCFSMQNILVIYGINLNLLNVQRIYLYLKEICYTVS